MSSEAPHDRIAEAFARIPREPFLPVAERRNASDDVPLPIRKAGKLPRPAAAVSYTLEYGTATIEGPDVLKKGERVLLIDDILATGGTLTAAQSLVADLGAEVIGSAVVLELTALGGREHTGEVHTLFAE